MKLLNEAILEEESVGDFLEINAGIDMQNLPLIISLASKNLYSDPISSIVREITSNCYDANKESGSEEPILIYYETNLEDNTVSINFKDNGLGLSPAKIKDIYMNWFSSTKRESNLQIGGKGIGSKTPLSYQTYFYIITIHENIKYEYVLAKTNDIPKLTLLSKNETIEKFGTTIKIELLDVKEKYSTYDDVYKFFTACQKQLNYFEGVYVKSFTWHYNNNFQIIEGKYFKYKSDDRPYNTMHICLGQVTYPLDFTILKIPINKTEIALKFEIGELDVTLSRENIEYNDRSIALIKERIELVKEELTELYYKTNQPIQDFKEYLKNRHKSAVIYLSETITLSAKTLDLETDKVYAYIKDLVIPNDSYLFYNYTIFKIENGFIKNIRDFNLEHFLGSKKSVITAYPDKFNNIIFNNGYLLLRKKLDYREYAAMFKFERVKNYYHGATTFYEKLALIYKNKLNDYKLGKAKAIYTYIKHIHNYWESQSVNYYQATPEWIKEYKLENRKVSNKIKGKILIYTKSYEEERQYVAGGWGRSRKYAGIEIVEVENKKEIALSVLAKYKYVFYEIKYKTDNKNTLIEYQNLVQNHSLCKNKQVIFLRTSQENLKLLQKLNKTKNSKWLYKSEDVLRLKVFRPFLCKVNLANDLNLTKYADINLSRFSKYYFNLYEKLKSFKDTYQNKKINLDLSKATNKQFPVITGMLDEVETFYKKIELFNFINWNVMPKELKQEIIKIIKQNWNN